MFQVGEYIIYGNSGVCRVEKIGSMEIGGVSSDRLYYTLVPVYENKSTIYTPVDNEKVTMRPIITKDEAYELIDNIKLLDSLSVEDDREKEQVFKEAFHKRDCEELVRIIKMLYEDKQQRLTQGKKNTSSNERYFKLAEDGLYGELAIALGIEKKDVGAFIEERLK